MAYLFADGFDNYTNASQIWDFVQGTTPTYATANARFLAPAGLSGQGIAVPQNSFIRKNLISNQVTVILGFACQLKGSLALIEGIAAVLDSTTTQIGLGITPTGAAQFYRGGFSTAVGPASSPALIQINTWHYYEMVVTVDSTTGALSLYLDGGPTPIISASGLNTKQSSNAFINQISIGDFTNNNPNVLFDDLYCFDNTTGVQNAVLGDTRIITKMPNGAGTTTQWSASGAAANWQAVKEIPPDDDTSYVFSNTPGQTDYYTTQNAGLSGTPGFVVLRRRHRKDDAGVHTDQSSVSSSGSTASSTAVTVPSGYAFQDDNFITDPHTSAAWTAAAADNTQIGVIETS